jgi:eukaryotic-like serine/threonine-protein kinase
MTPERWQQVDKLLEQALEKEPSHRDAFLEGACKGDTALRHEVESLLEAHEQAGSLLSSPALAGSTHQRADLPQSMTGRNLGHYQILSRLGEGGMGIVYKARDTHLDRFVAIKVLPPELVADPDRKRRFVQEAKAASALNHPNIITIHDIASENGRDFMVMEYVEGKSLDQLIPRRGLKLNLALNYAVQMADALAKAHSAGIIHRDLKPGNIMVTEEGLVKVLDFGLAKLTERPQTGKEESTGTLQPQTEEGMILGTVSYMSPEQAAGKPVDARSDIFSFGSVLYEMVTGQRAFQGDSKMSTLAAILDQEPKPAREIARTLPYDLEKIITRCLRKDVERRFQHMGDVKVELDELRHSTGDPALVVDSLSQTQGSLGSQSVSALGQIKRRNLLVWISAAIFSLAVMFFAVAYFQRPPAELQSLKLSVLLPENASLDTHAVSPDGTQLAFVARAGDKTHLWLRPLSSVATRPLVGTEGAQGLFWSPDSNFIGFFTKDGLKRIALSSGTVTALSDVADARGGSWSGDGEIVFAPRISDALYRVSASGGAPVLVTMLDRSLQEDAHRWPWFLPDGRHFLYFVRSSRRDQQGIYVGSLDSKEKKRLLGGAIGGIAYVAPGYLLFVQNGTLVAQPFDPNRLEITGDPLSVVERVKDQPGWSAPFSVSTTNVLTYRRGDISDTELVWSDRAGKQLQSVAAPAWTGIFRLSPDGTRLAGNRVDPETAAGDIWLLELSPGKLTRFTVDPSYEYLPVWSPDGTRIVFSSNRDGPMDLYLKALNGPDKSEVLLKSNTEKRPEDWSLDERFILYSNFDSKTNQFDLWALPLFGDRQPLRFLTTPFEEKQAQFSPDGRWVAYCSDESGRDEVYVQSFPVAGNKVLISTEGGTQPRWRRDGKELFYLAADGKLMALEVKGGSTLKAGVPKALPLKAGLAELHREGRRYAVAADGQRFLIHAATKTATPDVIDVVLNWTTGLKR